MSRSTARLCLAAVVVGACFGPTLQQPVIGSSYSGQGTYYGGQNLGGHCSLQVSGTGGAAWTTGVGNGVALNRAQYAGSAGCGTCIVYRGTGTGLGTAPIPTTWQYGIVTDECPECADGDLDLATSGDGRWGVEWQAVQCNTGDTPVQYSFQGSNNYYLKLQVANTRVPAASVQVLVNGQWVTLTRTSDNYFELTSGGPFNYPLQTRVTSVLGDSFDDTIESIGGTISGNKQFAASSANPVVGSGSINSTNTTRAGLLSPSPSPGASLANSTSPSPSLANSTSPSPSLANSTSPSPASGAAKPSSAPANGTSPSPSGSPSPSPSPAQNYSRLANGTHGSSPSPSGSSPSPSPAGHGASPSPGSSPSPSPSSPSPADSSPSPSPSSSESSPPPAEEDENSPPSEEEDQGDNSPCPPPPSPEEEHETSSAEEHESWQDEQSSPSPPPPAHDSKPSSPHSKPWSSPPHQDQSHSQDSPSPPKDDHHNQQAHSQSSSQSGQDSGHASHQWSGSDSHGSSSGGNSNQGNSQSSSSGSDTGSQSSGSNSQSQASGESGAQSPPGGRRLLM